MKIHTSALVIFQIIAGPNGAGKTTTMRMIIAEENPTRGKIRIGKHNIESNTSPGFDQLGYCPQVGITIPSSDIRSLCLNSMMGYN